MLTLQDLREVCDRYVPLASRHERSFSGPAWWPAHEIGHLLVAKPAEIGEPLFGIGDVFDNADAKYVTAARQRYLLTVECAAMIVSRRLLIAAGKRSLATDEAEDTDHDTMTWWFDNGGRVTEFLRLRCPGVPRSRTRLEALCAMALRRAGRAR